MFTLIILAAAIALIFYSISYEKFEQSAQKVQVKNVDEIDSIDDQFNDIAQGNIVSYANKQNPQGKESKTHESTSIPVPIQGTPINDTISNKIDLPESNMFYFGNYLASADCCPSNYTTDQGCVCWYPNSNNSNNSRSQRVNNAIGP